MKALANKPRLSFFRANNPPHALLMSNDDARELAKPFSLSTSANFPTSPAPKGLLWPCFFGFFPHICNIAYQGGNFFEKALSDVLMATGQKHP